MTDVRGVVTAVFADQRNGGFWIEDPIGDGDPASSEGIFVSMPGLPPASRPGDLVRVSGTVEEWGSSGSLTTTRIVQATLEIIARDHALPGPVVIGREGRVVPANVIDDDGLTLFEPGSDAIDFWESLEGMRVTVRSPVVVGPTSGYGDFVVLADSGAGSEVRTQAGGIVLQENDVNPERITVSDRLIGQRLQLAAGDVLTPELTGVVDYFARNYRLLQTSPWPEVIRAAESGRAATLRGDDQHLTIATWNVLNLSAADPDEKFRSIGESIARRLGSPDILALQEIQDDSGPADDGIVTAERTFARLIEAIASAGGARYAHRQIDPENNRDGGQPGGNIRVGLLFNPKRVAVVDRENGGPRKAVEIENGASVALRPSPGKVAPMHPCFAAVDEAEGLEGSRKSLAIEFRFAGRPLFVINNHFRSKRGDDPLFGAKQPPGRASEEQRLCQAEVIRDFVRQILSLDSEAAVVVLGDLNEQEFRPPVVALKQAGLINLIDEVPLPERYTYIFEGNSQVLDHILLSPAIAAGASVEIVHGNIDLPASRAASDHDAVLARVKLR